jgi:enoyl-CoA hydratase/3-hydroxyacyl-CoA dehydrogenase
VIPYRKWPHAAETFHAMIGQAKRLTVQEAKELGMLEHITESYPELIAAAIDEVQRLQGNIPRITEEAVAISEFKVPEQPVAGKLALSRQALGIVARVINEAAAAQTLAAALEINYQGSGDISCIAASKEGVSAFLQKRKPVFSQ